jgi:hypothetical protein
MRKENNRSEQMKNETQLDWFKFSKQMKKRSRENEKIRGRQNVKDTRNVRTRGDNQMRMFGE